jgi:hypothetical protein
MALAISVILPVMTGCVELTNTKTPPKQAAAPGAFPWSNETIEATGTNSGPRNLGNEVQASVVAKQAAKTAAIANLKEKIMNLNVTSSRSLGSVMSQNLGIKRAVEQYLQATKVVSEREVMTGIWEVKVKANMAPISYILERNHVTSDNVPSAESTSKTRVPPVS